MINSIKLQFIPKAIDELEIEIQGVDLGSINRLKLEIDNQWQVFEDVFVNSELVFMQEALNDLRQIVDIFKTKFNNLDDGSKKWIIYALNYFMETYDIVPDTTSDYGYADDAIIFKTALNKVKSSTDDNSHECFITIEMDDGYIDKKFNDFCKNNGKKIDSIKKKLDFKKKNFIKSCERSKFSFMKDALIDLEELIRINSEEHDSLDDESRNWLIFALDYLNTADDYMPDYLKQVGYVDDAIILKVALNQIKREMPNA